MKPEVKAIIDYKLQTLDKETELGIFPEIKRQINDGDRFLIISYGGTGGDALYHLKKTLENNIDKAELDEKVRFLCIDTQWDAAIIKKKVTEPDGQTQVVNAKKFTDQEFLWLDNNPASKAVLLNDAGMQSWINPRLPAVINNDKTYLDGSGAGSTRQIGRVLLYPQESVTDLGGRISMLVRQLTNNNADNLRVFIITGISGGTGSGIVIDASYLIRYFIEQIPGNMENRTKICGFIMLPPTGTSDNANDIEKGNRNGIAALKEIDHYMTISRRGEEYFQTFGATSVRTYKNIFDICYLLDGGTGTMNFGNPKERANEVVGECILDLITSLPVVDSTGQPIQNVEAFMSDVPAYTMQMVGNTSEQVAPREANYIYCAVGHGKTLIPLELMKAYVAGNAFGKMYNLFRNCSNVTEDDVEDFIDNVKLKLSEYNPQHQAQTIDQEIDNVFKNIDRSAKKGGPFYAINLLKAAAVYCQKEIKEIESKAIVFSKEEKIEQYTFIKNHLLKRNNETFTVYVEVMEQMKKYFQIENGILCDSEKFQTYTGTTYTFTPINFTALNVMSQKVKTYLAGIISNKDLDMLTDGLVKSMISKRAEWTEALPAKQGTIARFDAPTQIRQFWQENIGRILDATIEDFLIKYYSGNVDAKYETQPTPAGEVPTDATVKWLSQAAKSIVSEMVGPAGIANPLAALRTSLLSIDKFNVHYFILVPKAATHLKQYIENEVALQLGNGIRVTVAKSYANDRISCYAQYTGIPAFMFEWALKAEGDYEDALRQATIGLHMSETKGGKLWRNYPNLIPEGIWSKISSPEYSNEREQGINANVKKVFDRAVGLGLAHQHALATNADFGYYELQYLPETYRPDPQFFKAVDGELEGSQARALAEQALAAEIDKKADELFGMADWLKASAVSRNGMAAALVGNCGLKYGVKSLQFTNTVLTAYTNAAVPKPDKWEETLGAKLLRLCPEDTDIMRGTVAVLDKLYEKISFAQSARIKAQRFAQFLAADLFYYNEDIYQWSYLDGIFEKPLAELDVGNEQQKAAEYYFMYKEYEKKAYEIEQVLSDAYSDITTDLDKAKAIDKQKKFIAKAGELNAKVKKAYMPDRTNPDQVSIISTQAYRALADKRGYDVDEIVGFYQDLDANLQTISVNPIVLP